MHDPTVPYESCDCKSCRQRRLEVMVVELREEVRSLRDLFLKIYGDHDAATVALIIQQMREARKPLAAAVAAASPPPPNPA